MEDTAINGETSVLEETLEDTVVDIDAGSGDTVSDSGEEPVDITEGIGSDVVESEPGTTLDATEQSEGAADDVPSEPQEEYSLENPMPVMIVEPQAVEEELQVFSLSGSYPGTISETYLNYFRGIVQKLDSREHYVVYRSGQYSYTMVYGEGVDFNGQRFTGEGNVCTIYRNSSSSSSDWYVSFGTDTLSLNAENLFVYSDLDMFPTLKEGGSAVEFTALLFAVGFAVVYSVCHDIYDYVMEHVFRK